MGQKRFTWKGRARSFGFAFAGLKYVFSTQHNFRIHLAISAAVIMGGFVLKVSANDWRWIIVATALVFVTEILNTAIELACDAVTPEFHHAIQKAKDIAAGAVLVAAIGAALIGILIFWPYLSSLSG
jgi:diacylglycerol kinase (ATP)